MKKTLPLLLMLPLVLGGLVFPSAQAEVLRPPVGNVAAFGASVAVEGTKMLVGSNGIVFWYDDWTNPSAEPKRFHYPDSVANVAYGADVAFAGRTDPESGGIVYDAVVGASAVMIGEYGRGGTYHVPGAAYLLTDLTEVNGSSDQFPVVVIQDPDITYGSDRLGSGVGIHSGRFIVGGGNIIRQKPNPDYDAQDPESPETLPNRSGDVYAYDVSNPTSFQSLYVDPAAEGDPLLAGFGDAAAMNATHALVGSTMTNGCSNGFGSAHLFKYDADASEWRLERRFLPDPEEDEWSDFGRAVALGADSVHAAVASLDYPIYSIYIFRIDTGEKVAKINKSGVNNFGNCMVLGDTHLLVGTNGSVGKVWLYEYGGGDASEILTLEASDPSIKCFGWSLALDEDGDHFAVGAYNAVVTGRISSMLTLEGGMERSVKGLSFSMSADWTIGGTTSGNTMHLGEGDKATIAPGKAVYVGKSAGANNNTFELRGTIAADSLHIGAPGNTGNALRGSGTISAATTIAGGSTLALGGFMVAEGSALVDKHFTFNGDLAIASGTTLEITAPDGIIPARIASGASLTFAGAVLIHLGGDPSDWLYDPLADPADCVTLFTNATAGTLPTAITLAGQTSTLSGTPAALQKDATGRVYIPGLKNVSPRLKAAPDAHSAPYTGGTFTVAVKSNVSWTVASDSDWLTFTGATPPNTGDKNFTVTVARNPDLEPRLGTITISNGAGLTHDIHVTQAATPVSLVLDPMTIYSPSSGTAAMPVKVTTNVPWTAAVSPASQTWLTISATSGNTGGDLAYTDPSAFTVTAVPCPLGHTRHGFITVTAAGVARTIVVTQAPEPPLNALPNNPLIVWTQVDTSTPATPAITIAWPLQNATMTAREGVFIHRRLLHQTANTDYRLIATVPPSEGNSFTDRTVELGQSYEYRIMRNPVPGANPAVPANTLFIAVAVDTPLEDQRGTLLFVVDETLPAEMEHELRLAEMDLAGDGWDVVRITHEQHRGISKTGEFANARDTLSANGQYSHINLKERIVAAYNDTWDAEKQEHSAKALYLFGRLPVARGGNIAPDAHAPARAAPTDTYYADIDGIWTDTGTRSASASEDVGNVPGDGKFDQIFIPLSPAPATNAAAELMTGRVDFARIPASRKNEREHLRDYIQKAHAWKHNLKHIPHRLASSTSGEFHIVTPTFLALAGGPANLANDRWSANTATSYLMHSDLHPPEFDIDTYDSKIFFGLSLSSWWFDWYNWFRPLRHPLAQAEWGLLNCWGGRPQWSVHHMAAGLPAGYSYLRTVNARGSGYPAHGTANIHINLFGDPTLRLVPVRPPRNLTVSSAAAAANLAWKHPLPPQPTDGGAPLVHDLLGYRVYRSTTGHASGYQLIATLGAGATTYTDSTPRPASGTVYYQVRANYRTTVPTGIYNHQSQGIFNALAAGATHGNTAPVARAFAVTTTTDAPAYLDLGGTGTAGATLTPIITANPERGQVRWAGGKAHYVSNLGVTGPDTLKYRLWDGLALSEEQTVTVTVVAPADPASRLLAGWQFRNAAELSAAGTVQADPAATYRQTASMPLPALSKGSAASAALHNAYEFNNKAYAIRGLGLHSTGVTPDPDSYIAWTVGAPGAGNWQTLDRVAFFVFDGDRGGGFSLDDNPTDRFNIELRASVDGFATSVTVPIDGLDAEGKVNAAGIEKNSGVLLSADLRTTALAQSTQAAVQFRLYFWNVKNTTYQVVGIGKSARGPVQNPFDLAVFGRLTAAPMQRLAFDPNGATSGTPPAPIYDETDAALTLPDATNLARTGYEFLGWNTQPDGKGTNLAAGAAYTMPAGGATLYARWQPTANYYVWADENGLYGSDAALTASPRGDGITNLAKYALGLDGSRAAHYTDTGYYTTTTKEVGSGTSAKNLLVFTYAVSRTTETVTAVAPSFSKDLEKWNPVTPVPVLPDDPESPLRLFTAEGDFTDGKGFFRLEINEK